MEREVHDRLLTVFGNATALRCLVEAVVMTMSLEDQAVVAQKFLQSTELVIARLLGGAAQEAAVSAMEEAVSQQRQRLRTLGVPFEPEAPA